MHPWFAHNTWCYINVLWLIDWLPVAAKSAISDKNSCLAYLPGIVTWLAKQPWTSAVLWVVANASHNPRYMQLKIDHLIRYTRRRPISTISDVNFWLKKLSLLLRMYTNSRRRIIGNLYTSTATMKPFLATPQSTVMSMLNVRCHRHHRPWQQFKVLYQTNQHLQYGQTTQNKTTLV